MTPTRLIIFLELVRGCNNRECPSWGGVCDYKGIQTMSWDTLEATIMAFEAALPRMDQFEVIDLWTYGCGDSLEHPDFRQMTDCLNARLGSHMKLSCAVDARRPLPAVGALDGLSKVKMIHKHPESYDWIGRAREWRGIVDPAIPMSHKLIPQGLITKNMWDAWKANEEMLVELKAVPWHDIPLGTDDPSFTRRILLSCEDGVPSRVEPYPGRPVRRVMICHDGKLRRCLVCPTDHPTIRDLVLGEDSICQSCYPLTSGNLARFETDYVRMTPSASCVSDGYIRV